MTATTYFILAFSFLSLIGLSVLCFLSLFSAWRRRMRTHRIFTGMAIAVMLFGGSVIPFLWFVEWKVERDSARYHASLTRLLAEPVQTRYVALPAGTRVSLPYHGDIQQFVHALFVQPVPVLDVLASAVEQSLYPDGQPGAYRIGALLIHPARPVQREGWTCAAGTPMRFRVQAGAAADASPETVFEGCELVAGQVAAGRVLAAGTRVYRMDQPGTGARWRLSYYRPGPAAGSPPVYGGELYLDADRAPVSSPFREREANPGRQHERQTSTTQQRAEKP